MCIVFVSRVLLASSMTSSNTYVTHTLQPCIRVACAACKQHAPPLAPAWLSIHTGIIGRTQTSSNTYLPPPPVPMSRQKRSPVMMHATPPQMERRWQAPSSHLVPGPAAPQPQTNLHARAQRAFHEPRACQPFLPTPLSRSVYSDATPHSPQIGPKSMGGHQLLLFLFLPVVLPLYVGGHQLHSILLISHRHIAYPKRRATSTEITTIAATIRKMLTCE